MILALSFNLKHLNRKNFWSGKKVTLDDINPGVTMGHRSEALISRTHWHEF